MEATQAEVSLMSLPQRWVAGSLNGACEAGSSVNFSLSLKRTPNEILLDSLFKGNLPLFTSPTVSGAFAVKLKCVIFLMFKYFFYPSLNAETTVRKPFVGLFSLKSLNTGALWWKHVFVCLRILTNPTRQHQLMCDFGGDLFDLPMEDSGGVLETKHYYTLYL